MRTTPPAPASHSVPPRTTASDASGRGDWVRRMRRHIGWLFVVKLTLLTLLFVFFFSASHRPEIGAAQVSDRIKLESATP